MIAPRDEHLEKLKCIWINNNKWNPHYVAKVTK